MRPAKRAFWLLLFLISPAWTMAGKDTKDYPVMRVEILMTHWKRTAAYPFAGLATDQYVVPEGVRMAALLVNGQGNIMDGSVVQAFDFKYEVLNDVIPDTCLNQTYLARWKKPGRELQVLAPAIYPAGKYMIYIMETKVRKGVYVGGRGSETHEVSQEEYQARKAQPENRCCCRGPQQPAAVANVSVTSNPAGADIKVDGIWMAMTPWVLELAVGEHTVDLRKAGFKPWQSKMIVASGDNKLKADLEPDAGK